MDIVGWTKRFFFKICDKIEDRLASILAGGILLIALVVCIVFWEWLKAIHSLKMYGWSWLLILGISLISCCYTLYTVSENYKRIKDPSDIRNVIRKWWRHCTEQNPKQREFTLYFSAIDHKERLKKGSAKRYLREIVTKDAHCGVVREGPKTLIVKRKEYTVTVGPDG